jgi:hypothetical protein
LKKLFIGHFGGKDKEDWFFSWADNEEEALKTIERVFGEPAFIEDVSNVSSGGFCFKPIDISTDENPYYLLEPFQDDFKFESDEYIQDVINKQKIKKNNDGIKREEYRKLIEKENNNQKKLEESEYAKIREKLDRINL